LFKNEPVKKPEANTKPRYEAKKDPSSDDNYEDDAFEIGESLANLDNTGKNGKKKETELDIDDFFKPKKEASDKQSDNWKDPGLGFDEDYEDNDFF